MANWRDAEGEFVLDLEGMSWSFEGAGTIAVGVKKGGGTLMRTYGPSSGTISQTWEYEGRKFFFGHVVVFNGMPIEVLVKPTIQGSVGDFDGIVSLFLGTPFTVHVTGWLESELSGAEPSGHN